MLCLHKLLMIEIKRKEIIKCICQFVCQVWKFDYEFPAVKYNPINNKLSHL